MIIINSKSSMADSWHVRRKHVYVAFVTYDSLVWFLRLLPKQPDSPGIRLPTVATRLELDPADWCKFQALCLRMSCLVVLDRCNPADRRGR